MLRVVSSAEALLDLDEEAKRHATAEVGFRDDHVSEVGRIERVGLAGGGAGVGDVVDEILVVGVGELLRRVVGDLGQDDGGEAAGAGGGGDGVLGEDGVFVGDARVEEWRRWDGGGSHGDGV